MSEVSNKNISEKLEEIKLDPRKILLNPNNERFIYSFSADSLVQHNSIDRKQVQEDALDEMNKPEHDVKSIQKSILQRGFLLKGNAPILVQKFKDDVYYLREGNRRITAIKNIFKDVESGKKHDEERIKELKLITVQNATELNEDEINVLLGTIHIEGHKPWSPLQVASQLFHKYMKSLIGPNYKFEDFKYDVKTMQQVAAFYNINLSDTRESIKTYKAFMEIENDERVPPGKWSKSKYSVILEIINKPTLRDHFGLSDTTYKFSEKGFDKLINHLFPTDGKPPIIAEASRGDRSVRKLYKVLKLGNEEEQNQVLLDGVSSQDVITQINSRKLKPNFKKTLVDLNRILSLNITDFPSELASSERETVIKIVRTIEKWKKQYGIQEEDIIEK